MIIADAPTLILNKSWHAIDATTVQDAFCKMFAGRAEAVCPHYFTKHSLEDWLTLEVPEGDSCIKTSQGDIRIPEVIVATVFNKVPRRTVVFSRRNLWRRDRYRCQYCGCLPKPDEITIDHVVPQANGGKSTFENCVLACLSCNQKKDRKTPKQAGMHLKRLVKGTNGDLYFEAYTKPSRPAWSPIYSTRRKKIPVSWKNFLHEKIDELYWHTEIDP